MDWWQFLNMDKYGEDTGFHQLKWYPKKFASRGN